MLKPNQRAYLRKLAQTMSPIFQVGKNGVSDNQIEQLINALEARELIKITILNTTPDDKHSIAEEIADKTGAEIVHVIGNKLTIYKRSANNPRIELPM
ncbi:MAG: ribosome assembly RNA-binding protein YhbY [Clostridia bacterium]|nr:ribosome assembly RNA-binding protein YhbY [Clostridia bacterium]